MITEEQYAEWFRKNENMLVDKQSDGTWETNGLYIRSEKVIKEIKSIGRMIEKEVTEYVICGVSISLATFWEPEDPDEIELARVQNFGSALIKVLLLEKENELNHKLQDWEEFIELEQMK
jgi:hypothetical protein